MITIMAIGININIRRGVLEPCHTIGIGPNSTKPVVEPKPLALIESIIVIIPTIISISPVNMSSLGSMFIAIIIIILEDDIYAFIWLLVILEMGYRKHILINPCC
jgi:hypothetical protein